MERQPQLPKISKILVLDDEPDIQSLYLQKFRKQIADQQYKFTFAQNNNDAISILREEKDFDIIISDIHVGGADGIDFIGKIREQFPLIRSIVVSAYGDINTLRAAMRGGAHDFVIKPTDFQDLSDTLEKTVKFVKSLKHSQETEKRLSAITDELDVSAKLQRSILPGNFLKHENIEIYADTTPAAEVGGDFYDFFWLSPTKIGIVMADVSGKNISAAMFMTMARTLLKSFAMFTDSPAECFSRVNKSLSQENVSTMFVTAMYGIVDIESGILNYTNAGHLPIAVFHPKKETVFLSCDPGMALGIDQDVEFTNNIYQFTPGDTIMLYTDGVPEAANIDGQEYDYDKFEKILNESRNLTPQAITMNLMKSIRDFVKNFPQSDDITTLCLRYRLRRISNAT